MPSHRPDALRRLALLLALATILGMAIGASAGEARQMTVFSCHDPAGNPVGHDGWSVNRTGDLDMSVTDSCSAGGQGALGLELGASVSGYPNEARAEWIFTAPAWASIASYTLQIAGSYAIPSTGAGSGQAFVNASDESDPNYDYRNLGAAEQGAYTLRRTPPAPVSSIDLNASCDGQYGPCPGGARVSAIGVAGATLLLDDSSTPTVSGLSGSLLSGASLTDLAEVSFTASDSGPGVYSAALVVDGQSQPASILSTNNGWCENLGQTSDGTRSFAHPDPCPQTVSGTLTLDTSALHDGPHSLKLVVDDASGDATTAYNATITTDNGLSALSSPPGPSAGGGFASSAEGAPNGAGASRLAQVRLSGARSIARSFTRRALKLAGRLQDAQGRPIADAALDVLQRVAGSRGSQLIGQVRTAADGSFAAGLPAGPSRTIEVAYRAFSGDSNFAAEARIEESVSAGVALKVSPRHTSSTGVISLSGRVGGPIPRRGVVVELLVHYLGRWEPFRTPRTDASGRFRVAYRFEGAVGRYPFRAEVLGGQSGFPFAGGASRTVDVVTD
jgi:hypothetical protein